MKKRDRRNNRILRQLHRDGIDPAEHPTNVLFVSCSSVLMGVEVECLEQLFHQFDPDCTIFVCPNKSYSIVQFSAVEIAIETQKRLNDTRPDTFPEQNPPVALLFLEKVPERNLPKSNLKLDGFKLVDDIVNQVQENELIALVERQLSDGESTRLKHRKVFHFGYKFNYDENNALERTTPIPAPVDALIDRICLIMKDGEGFVRPDQVTVNVYEPGQGIPPHTDTHSAFEEHICSLSLGSDVVMEFRDAANTLRNTDMFLPRRSLMVLAGRARYRFKHAIPSRKFDINLENGRLFRRQRRISITFRTVRLAPCQCQFIEFCDWDRNGRMEVPISEKQGAQLEREYVAKIYEQIAAHFDATRYSSWKLVAEFLNSLAPGSTLLDAGCGNGKYLLREDALVKFGCDISGNLLRLVRQKKSECSLFQADALQLPVRDGLFDAAISIAVIHHFSTRERRKKAIAEIIRVLRPGGLACVTAWSFEQTDESQVPSIYASKMRANKLEVTTENGTVGGTERLRIHDGKVFTQQDMLVPWSSPTTEVDRDETGQHDCCFRYYHLFVRGELAGLVEEFAEQCTIESLRYDEGNWVVVFRKSE